MHCIVVLRTWLLPALTLGPQQTKPGTPAVSIVHDLYRTLLTDLICGRWKGVWQQFQGRLLSRRPCIDKPKEAKIYVDLMKLATTSFVPSNTYVGCNGFGSPSQRCICSFQLPKCSSVHRAIK